MRQIFLWIGIVCLTGRAETVLTGFVTPTAMTLTFSSLSLIKADSSEVILLEDSYSHEFRRDDADFTAIPLSNVNIPANRYIGAKICYSTEREILLDGVKYEGFTGTIADGDPIFSVGTDALTAGSIQNTDPGDPTTLTGYVTGTGETNCSLSYFSAPICVAAGGDGCSSGDDQIDALTTTPTLNLVMDLYHSVGVDASQPSLDNHVPVYPYVTMGDPGAAVHLKAEVAGAIGNISLLMDGAQKLLYAAAFGNNFSIDGFCTGVAAVDTTEGPTGAYVNAFGPTFVMDLDTATGMVQFATGSCTDSECLSNGMLTIPNFRQAVNETTTVTCPPDSEAVPPYLGFTYTDGAGAAPNNGSDFAVVRIVDPQNVLGGICTSESAGYLSDSVGTCATEAGDGYP